MPQPRSCRIILVLASALPLCASFAARAPALPRNTVAAAAAAPVGRTAQVALTAADSSEEASSTSAPIAGGFKERADAIYRFSRPHTIRGTLLACFTGVGRALIESPAFLPMLPAMLPRALLGVLALLLGNLFIVGINQIYDVGIDKVNKPFLPIAAGRLSPKAAWLIVVGSGLAALGIVKAAFSPLIFYLFCFGTTIGGLYSVPPFQLKRFPLAAGMTIAT